MQTTKVILLCGNRIGLPVIRQLVFHQQLVAVVVPEICSEFAEQVSLLLKESNIPVIMVNEAGFTDSMHSALEKYSPDLGIVFTFSYKIPETAYSLPSKGFYNIHPGPLPAYRGPDPLFWQMKNMEPYISVTIHSLDEGFDTGNIVLAEKFRLGITDTYGMVTTKTGELASRMVETLMKLASYEMQIPSRKQPGTGIRYYKKQAAGDVMIQWQYMKASDIIALINACNPWNRGALAIFKGNIIRLIDAQPLSGAAPENSIPGQVIAADDQGIRVAVAGNEMIGIRLIYCEEGYLLGTRLTESGFLPGSFLE